MNIIQILLEYAISVWELRDFDNSALLSVISLISRSEIIYSILIVSTRFVAFNNSSRLNKSKWMNQTSKVKTYFEDLYWLILSQSFYKWRNIWSFSVHLYLLLLSVSICEFQHFITFKIRKENMMLFLYTAQDCMWSKILLLIWNVISTTCRMHHSYIVIQNNNILSFLIIKVTKCWNSHVDTLSNNKYKCAQKLQHVSSLMKRRKQK